MSPSLPACPRRSAPLLVHAATLVLLALAVHATPARGQTLDDGLTLPRRQLRVGVEYGHDRWDRYWEGTLRRSNENIGTLTTQSVTWTAGYGVTSRLTVFATIPHVWTRASEGVLQEMRGWQDVTVAAKLGLLERRVADRATVGTVLLVAVGAPISDYTPDFLPLSIGLGARRATARGVVHLRDHTGVFAEAGAGHTWRSTVHLDRPAYYTDGHLVLSDEVAMPDVFDYAVGAGYQRGGLRLPIMLVGQRTLGGGDIRRQDMPFVSNRMDFVRLQARAMYALPRARGVMLGAGFARTLTGRNVGQSTTLWAGLTTVFGL
ncbi:MAG TPA: hypothetical protein VFS08_18145 [Gemmatimonadaceae bacterium]|nr:hypothetical protein [Gemmatimonadaceae bacterium]